MKVLDMLSEASSYIAPPIHCFPSEASSVGGMARKSKYITGK